MLWEAISNTRKSVSSDVQTLPSWIKNTRLRLAFSTHFSVFGYLMKHSSLCLIYYINYEIAKTVFSTVKSLVRLSPITSKGNQVVYSWNKGIISLAFSPKSYKQEQAVTNFIRTRADEYRSTRLLANSPALCELGPVGELTKTSLTAN